MKKLFTILLITVFATAAWGCDSKKEETSESPEKTEAAATDEEAEADEAEDPAEDEQVAKGDQAEEGETVAMVEVPAEGKEYDPPVEKARVPGGAWICDMGTVHWASTEKPEDGKCPVCGMQLKKHEHAGDTEK